MIATACGAAGRHVGRLLATAMLGLACFGEPVAWAADKADKSEKESGTVLKTEDGLRFKLPADWPIERRGGVTAPIPMEEYLSRKLTAIEARLQGLERQVSAFDLRLRVLEEQAKKDQHLKSVEATTP